ncbi:MAG: 16S rRNA (cytidine(1402)-2'-O)-methyltransferase, partial [Bacteroidetes bacterium]
MLYLVPTPLGNLEDFTLRAMRILREVDLILAEDTRTTRKLLDHYDISTPLKSYHAHNEHRATPALVEQLLQGRNLA